jgi:ATP-dependent Clp protease ATP-binding subunit ClpC
MQVHKHPVLVWKDSAGFYTASLADAEGSVEDLVPVVGYGDSAREALSQVKDYLKWYYGKFPWATGPTLTGSRLVAYKVKVRPEYRVDGKVFPSDRSLTLRVEVVDSAHTGGFRSAVIPRLGVEFFYTQGQLKDLVRHYVRESLTGQPPHAMARYGPPDEVFLETVTAKTRGEKPDPKMQPNLESLSVVAEPMGTKTLKTRFSRPYGRDIEVDELVRRLSGRGSNVLLVGEQGSGKTSLLLEAVRKVERTKTDEEARYPRRHWLTRGARLVAGMRYLGEWEERLEAVIGELSDIDGVLCLESLQEAVQTGGRGPEGSIAAFLTPYLERGEIVMVVEATPRELEACRRLLPSFVDLFHTLTLAEFAPSEALSVLGEVTVQLNAKYRLQADPNVVGECYRLHKRFLPYHSFPGKASQFLHQLYEESRRGGVDLARPAEGAIDREAAVHRFSRETGLPLKLLRDEDAWPVSEIRSFFEQRVVGQPAACQAASALVSTFKAGLNDPERPLGVLLFCGPTGVGKTEMAKAICHCFFGAGLNQDRLVRLDMSEYGGPGAAYRLMGSQTRPGELVRRVREQPFSVVLLDEFEKAHPDVFDLLLGVFDEGRLTDPWGRMTTFRSTVIVMTSNLGVSSLGPIGINQSRAPSYAAEVMSFFRPEFFNRIDAVVSFTPLSPTAIRTITELELKAVGQREGVAQRGLTLRWTGAVLDHLAVLGYDARYGARPLKRAIEENVVVPLARYLVDNPGLHNCPIDLEVADDRVVLG